MDVNDIFKLPALPKSVVSGKRKAPPTGGAVVEDSSSEPTQKLARTEEGDAGPQNGSRRAYVSHVEEEDGDGQDQAAEFAPNGDADYFAEEDEEGRFFGGGLSGAQKDIMSILDADQDVSEQHMTLPECRKTLLGLERAIEKNREMRTKHADRPDKFVDSEIALDAAIGSLLLLTQNPALFFPELVRLNSISSLVDLLSHENVDITISVIKVLEELTDEDVGEANDGEQTDQSAEAFEQAFDSFLAAVLSTPLMELLMANITRLNPAEPAEQQGLYHSFSLIENLLSSPQAAVAAKNLLKTDFLPNQVFKRLPQAPAPSSSATTNNNSSEADEANRYYAAELLSVLLSLPDVSQESRDSFLGQDGLDCCLKVLSLYRKKEPRGDEIEFFENVFNIVCAVLDSEQGKKAFREAEGVELMLILMKYVESRPGRVDGGLGAESSSMTSRDRRMARARSIKVLDFAMAGVGEGAISCGVFVESYGLKTLFPAFMGKSSSSKKDKESPPQTAEDMEHLLGILSSLFTALPSDSGERLRLLAKFVSDDYEKVDRLLEVRDLAALRLERWASSTLQMELDEDERLLERLENGLATLQQADYILAWVCMEDDGVRDHAKMLLDRQGRSLTEVVDILKEFSTSIDEGDGEGTEGSLKKDILSNLIHYLEGSL